MNLASCRLIVGIVIVISLVRIVLSSEENVAQEVKTDDITAERILARLADVYRTSKSYSDSGIVKTVFHTDGDKRVDEKPFTTAFVRPDQFRFEYRLEFQMPGSTPMRHIVWANGKDVRRW